MTGSKYSAVRRCIAKLLASNDGRAALALNSYKSGTPIVPALEGESLGDFSKRIDQSAGSGRTVVAAVVMNGELQMAHVIPNNGSADDTLEAQMSGSVIAHPQTTVGMLFTMLSNHKQLTVKTEPFDYAEATKVAVPFEMPDRGGSLQPA